MTDQTLLNVSGLAVERIEVVPAGSLDSAAYGHGMPELAASCGGEACGPGGERFTSYYLREDWDWVEA